MDAKRQKELSERTRDRRLLGKVIEGYLAGPVLRLAPRTQVEVRRYLSQAWRSLHEHDPDQLDRRTVSWSSWSGLLASGSDRWKQGQGLSEQLPRLRGRARAA